MARIRKKKVKEAIKDSGGVMAAVAQKCGVTRQSMWDFFHKKGNEKFLEMLEQADESMTDIAENKMNTKIADGHWPAIKFRLESKGSKRGFISKQEVEHTGISTPIEINIIKPNNEKNNKLPTNNKTGPRSKVSK